MMSYHDDMSTTFVEEVPGLLERVEQATRSLRSSERVPAEVAALVGRLGGDLHVEQPQRLGIDPYLTTSLFAAGWRASAALGLGDDAERRRELRVALEQVRHALRDIASNAPYGFDVQPKQLLARLAADLPVAQPELARLLGVSARQLQRWLSPTGSAPSGEDARVRTVAQVVNQLKHTFTPAGVVAWFDRPHPQLGVAPIELLDDPLRHPQLVDLARSARTTTA